MAGGCLWTCFCFGCFAACTAAAVHIHNDNEDAADEPDGVMRAMIAIFGARQRGCHGSLHSVANRNCVFRTISGLIMCRPLNMQCQVFALPLPPHRSSWLRIEWGSDFGVWGPVLCGLARRGHYGSSWRSLLVRIMHTPQAARKTDHTRKISVK